MQDRLTMIRRSAATLFLAGLLWASGSALHAKPASVTVTNADPVWVMAQYNQAMRTAIKPTVADPSFAPKAATASKLSAKGALAPRLISGPVSAPFSVTSTVQTTDLTLPSYTDAAVANRITLDLDSLPAAGTVTPNNIDPVWSHDENYLIFASNRKSATDASVGQYYHLYALMSSGYASTSSLIQLTGLGADANRDQRWPALMGPSDTTIAYCDSLQGNGEAVDDDAYTLTVATLNITSVPAVTNAVQYLRTQYYVQHPTLAGGQVVFAARPYAPFAGHPNIFANDHELYALTLSGALLTRITSPSGADANELNPSYAPDGLTIAFDTNATDYTTGGTTSGIASTAITADKSRQIFVSTTNGTPLLTLPKVGTNVYAEQITTAPTNSIEPVWSMSDTNQYHNADGHSFYIYFASDRKGQHNVENGNYDIYYVRAATTPQTGTNPTPTFTQEAVGSNPAYAVDTSDPYNNYNNRYPAVSKLKSFVSVVYTSDRFLASQLTDNPMHPNNPGYTRTTLTGISDIQFPDSSMSVDPLSRSTAAPSKELFSSRLIDVEAPSLLRFNDGTGEVLRVELLDDTAMAPTHYIPAGQTAQIFARLSDRQSGVGNVWLQIKDPDSRYQDAKGLEHKVLTDGPSGESATLSGVSSFASMILGNVVQTTEISEKTVTKTDTNPGSRIISVSAIGNFQPGDIIGFAGGHYWVSKVTRLPDGSGDLYVAYDPVGSGWKAKVPTGTAVTREKTIASVGDFHRYGHEIDCDALITQNNPLLGSAFNSATMGSYVIPQFTPGIEDAILWSGTNFNRPTSGGSEVWLQMNPLSFTSSAAVTSNTSQITLDPIGLSKVVDGLQVGDQLQLEPGSANEETVIINAISGTTVTIQRSRVDDTATNIGFRLDHPGGITVTAVGLYTTKWTTPLDAPSDFYFDIIAYDNSQFPIQAYTMSPPGNVPDYRGKSANWRVYDNVWGMTTNNFSSQHGILVVNDYNLPQKFYLNTNLGVNGQFNLPNYYCGSELYVTDFAAEVYDPTNFPFVLPRVAVDNDSPGSGGRWNLVNGGTILPLKYLAGVQDIADPFDFVRSPGLTSETNFFPYRNGLGVNSYYDAQQNGVNARAYTDPASGWQYYGDPAASYLPKPNSQQYDIWRILSRGPIPTPVLNAYVTHKVKQPVDPVTLNLPGPSGDGLVPAADGCVLWISPVAGKEMVGPGTLADPNAIADITAFVNSGGRILIAGQSVGAAILASGSNPFYSNVLHVANYLGATNGYTRGVGSSPTGYIAHDAYDGAKHDFNRFYFSSRAYTDPVSGPGGLLLGVGSGVDWGLAPSNAITDGAQNNNANDNFAADATVVHEVGAAGGAQLIYAIDAVKGSIVAYANFGLESVSQNGEFETIDKVSIPPVLVNARSALIHNSVCFLRTGTIRGHISVANNSNQPVVGGIVVARNTAKPANFYTATTTQSGDYNIVGVPPGAYTITASNIGFSTATAGSGVTVHGGDSGRVNLALSQIATGSIKIQFIDDTTGGVPVDNASPANPLKIPVIATLAPGSPFSIAPYVTPTFNVPGTTNFDALLVNDSATTQYTLNLEPSTTTIPTASAAGASTLLVATIGSITVGQTLTIDVGTKAESAKVTAVDAVNSIITFGTPLVMDHAVGTVVTATNPQSLTANGYQIMSVSPAYTVTVASAQQTVVTVHVRQVANIQVNLVGTPSQWGLVSTSIVSFPGGVTAAIAAPLLDATATPTIVQVPIFTNIPAGTVSGTPYQYVATASSSLGFGGTSVPTTVPLVKGSTQTLSINMTQVANLTVNLVDTVTGAAITVPIALTLTDTAVGTTTAPQTLLNAVTGATTFTTNFDTYDITLGGLATYFYKDPGVTSITFNSNPQQVTINLTPYGILLVNVYDSTTKIPLNSKPVKVTVTDANNVVQDLIDNGPITIGAIKYEQYTIPQLTSDTSYTIDVTAPNYAPGKASVTAAAYKRGTTLSVPIAMVPTGSFQATMLDNVDPLSQVLASVVATGTDGTKLQDPAPPVGNVTYDLSVTPVVATLATATAGINYTFTSPASTINAYVLSKSVVSSTIQGTATPVIMSFTPIGNLTVTAYDTVTKLPLTATTSFTVKSLDARQIDPGVKSTTSPANAVVTYPNIMREISYSITVDASGAKYTSAGTGTYKLAPAHVIAPTGSVPAGATTVAVDDASMLVAGTQVIFGQGPTTEIVTVSAVDSASSPNTITFSPALAAVHPNGSRLTFASFNINVPMTPPGTLAVSVVDSSNNNAPVSGQTVTITGPAPLTTQQTAVTVNGVATFKDVIPGDYTITVAGGSGYSTGSGTVTVTPGNPGTATTISVTSVGSMVITVQDVFPTIPVPIVGVLVTAVNGGITVSGTTDANGQVFFSNILVGSYTVSVPVIAGYGSTATSVIVQVTRNATTNKILPLVPKGDLVITPVDNITGKTITVPLTVTIRANGKPTLTATSNGTATFTDALAGVVYSVTISDPLGLYLQEGAPTIIIGKGSTTSLTALMDSIGVLNVSILDFVTGTAVTSPVVVTPTTTFVTPNILSPATTSSGMVSFSPAPATSYTVKADGTASNYDAQTTATPVSIVGGTLTLKAASLVGATTLSVSNVSLLSAGMQMYIDTGAKAELATISSVDKAASTITLTIGLARSHALASTLHSVSATVTLTLNPLGTINVHLIDKVTNKPILVPIKVYGKNDNASWVATNSKATLPLQTVSIGTATFNNVLAGGTYTIIADGNASQYVGSLADGTASANTTVQRGQTKDVTIVLAPVSTLTIKLVTPSNAPITNTTTLFAINDSGGATIASQVVSNASTATFSNLPTGTYTVTATQQTNTPSTSLGAAAAVGATKLTLATSSGFVSGMVLKIAGAAGVEYATIVGAPVGNVVTISPAMTVAHATAAAVTGAPVPSYLATPITVSVVPSVTTLVQSIIGKPVGQATVAVNATLASGAKIPLTSGVKVTLTGASGSPVYGPLPIGTDGTVTIPNVTPGSYNVAIDATSANYGVGSATLAVVQGTPAFVTVNLAASTGSISGTVSISDAGQADNGDPIPGATVTLTPTTVGSVQTTTTASDGSYSFTNLAADSYTVKATAKAGGYSDSTAVKVTLSRGQSFTQSFSLTKGAVVTSPHTFSAGLQFISAPYDYSSTGLTLASILGYASPKMAVWVPASSVYRVTPDSPADTIRLGQGYWVRFPNAAPLAGGGTAAPIAIAPNVTSFTINLSAGWNMIGDPYLTAPKFSNITVSSAGGVKSTWAAATAGSTPLISPTLYSYSQSANAYVTHIVGKTGEAAPTLDPYVGYWIYASASCALLVPTN
ncbi:MAG TPA: carboxypeptidase-like regulatory domain-containing protein [Capsulimonadaceae bacterium]|jgi:hypothetical protein